MTTTAPDTKESVETTKGRALDAAETADAAITAALVVALLAVGRVLASGSLFQVVAAFVVAVLAARRRTRAVVIATCAAASVALILGGLGPVSQAMLAGVFGWCGGQGLKRGWGRIRTVGFTVLIAWPIMAATVLFFYPAVAINRKLRELVFDNIENQAKGFGNIIKNVGSLFGTIGLGPIEDAAVWLADGLLSVADFLIENWLLLIPATELVYSILYGLAIHAFGGAILRRIDQSLTEPAALTLLPSDSANPVPVEVSGALERNGTVVTVPLRLDIAPGEHVVVEGPNGAGKSTLLDTIAGLVNHETVERPGAVGLGSIGGTARVGQRPEAQVVGTTVEEDLRWGLDEPFDVPAALADVGLDMPRDRPTSELSGGELQRLALGAALRRRPRLLLADEVTSMLDPTEQARIIERLEALQGTAVVRTTHRNDAVTSDRRVKLPPLTNESRLQAKPDPSDLTRIHSAVTETRLLRLRDVGYAHNADLPWALPVLHGVDLSIHRYEMVMIEGRNGSGKSTLARILAGLSDPTEGEIDLATGLRRALAHQHVRLQLLRATVRAELASLAGVRSDGTDSTSDDPRQYSRATNLATSVELFDLEHLMDRRIDELSGGEQRRVLLAGLVARGVSLLVLDEPLAGLDAGGRADLASTLDRVRLAGTSIVVVSHDVDWEPPHVDQRLHLGDGRLVPVRR